MNKSKQTFFSCSRFFVAKLSGECNHDAVFHCIIFEDMRAKTGTFLPKIPPKSIFNNVLLTLLQLIWRDECTKFIPSDNMFPNQPHIKFVGNFFKVVFPLHCINFTWSGCKPSFRLRNRFCIERRYGSREKDTLRKCPAINLHQHGTTQRALAKLHPAKSSSLW